MYTKDESEDQVKEVSGEEYYIPNYVKPISIDLSTPTRDLTLVELIERFLTKDKLPPVGKEVAIYFYNKFSKRYILASGWYDDGWYIYGFDPYEKVEVMGWFELSEVEKVK